MESDGMACDEAEKPVASCDFDSWAFTQCITLDNKIKGIKDETGNNIVWMNTTTKEKYFLYSVNC